MLKPMSSDPGIQAEIEMIGHMLERMELTEYEQEILQRRRDMLLRGWMNVNK